MSAPRLSEFMSEFVNEKKGLWQKMEKAKITADLVRTLIRCESGRYYWKHRPREMFVNDQSFKAWNTRFAGAETMTSISNSTGYRQFGIFYNVLLGHRVAWLFHHGEWPKGQIDHINGDRTDNRIENLRDVTVAANSRNQSIRVTNTSGVTGVGWHRGASKWQAQIKVDRKVIYLGLFEDKSSAIAARYYANAKYGFDKSHGRKRKERSK